MAPLVKAAVMSGIDAPKAAKFLQACLGLTGAAIADFRSEHDNAMFAMSLGYNTHSEYRAGEKVETIVNAVASKHTARHAFRRLARARATDKESQ